MSHTYKYPRPAVSCDCVVFTLMDRSLRVLLIRRGHSPFAGQWALPGGFVEMDEDLQHAAARELQEETGLRTVRLHQLHTFGAVERDPRTRVISIVWYGAVNHRQQTVVADSDAAAANWFDVRRLPKLAFDHRKMVTGARRKFQSDVQFDAGGFDLLPRTFTIHQLQTMYETVLDRTWDEQRFRKKLLGMEILKSVDHSKGNRSQRRYRLDRAAVRALGKSRSSANSELWFEL